MPVEQGADNSIGVKVFNFKLTGKWKVTCPEVFTNFMSSCETCFMVQKNVKQLE